MNKLINLFLTMFKIGLFTFGGGYAMISILQDEFVERKKWIESDEFMNLVTIAESTPGPIAINSATYIGYKVSGILGSIVATIGMVIPSLTIIYIISLFFNEFLSIEIISNAFKGIQVCVIFLILSAGIRMFKKMKRSFYNILIMSITIICMILFSLFGVSFSSIFYILISGTLGVTLYLINSIRNCEKESNLDGDNHA